MTTHNIHITYTRKTEAEFTTEEKDLLTAAKSATYRSYVPYSHFSVGAALQLSNGEFVTGCNQENCAYPSGLCAERTAVFYANSQYPDAAIHTLCVAARGTDGNFTANPVTPCGACRQVLCETERRQGVPMRIILYGTDGIYFIESAEDLLPLSFTL